MVYAAPMKTSETPTIPQGSLRPPIRPTILVVEDEILLSADIAEELDAAGFSVLTALTGEEALMIVEGEAIDVLFTDIRLPGAVDGWQVAAAARRRNPKLPVIYVTGYEVEQPRMVSGSRFLVKPYRPRGVIEAIAALGVQPET